jgi:putative membrane protein
MRVRPLTAAFAAAALTLGSTVAAQVLSASSVAQTQKPTMPMPERDAPRQTAEKKAGSADAQFVHQAGDDGLAEVKLGQLAGTKASNAEVKQFAQQMVTEHGKANDELSALAERKNWHMPTEPGAKHKSVEASLQKLDGSAFDRAYMKEMVSAHQKAVALFKKQSTSGGDADLKAFATSTLPTLEKHLEMARSLNKKLASPTH